MRRVLATVVCLSLPVQAMAAQAPTAPPPKAVVPRDLPQRGTVIRPAGPVDPGIQAKTPPQSAFPTVVIKPADPSGQPHR